MRAVRKLTFLKRPKVFAPLLGIIVIVLILVLVVKNMSAPAVGSINQTPPAQAEAIDPYAQPGTYNSELVSFKYPAHYKMIPSKTSAGTLETVDYHSTDSTGKQINVAVETGSLDSESGVSYREQHKDIYRESQSASWTEFTKTDGTEDTFFIPHGNMLAIVSATAPYNNQAGDALFVASSLKWR